MILGHIILHARRQKLHLIDFPWTEMLAHGPNQNQTRHQNASDYSDRLLVDACKGVSWSSAPSRVHRPGTETRLTAGRGVLRKPSPIDITARQPEVLPYQPLSGFAQLFAYSRSP